jgi:metallophosphoesterase superfamily enzyme
LAAVEDVLDSLNACLDKRCHVDCSPARENHDRNIDEMVDHWPIELVKAGQRPERVLLHHQPEVVPGQCIARLCGYVHPVIKLESSIGLLQLPCLNDAKPSYFAGAGQIHSQADLTRPNLGGCRWPSMASPGMNIL